MKRTWQILGLTCFDDEDRTPLDLRRIDGIFLWEQRAKKLAKLLRSQMVDSFKRMVDGSDLIHHSNSGYASNWVTRLGHIGRLTVRVVHRCVACEAELPRYTRTAWKTSGRSCVKSMSYFFGLRV